MFGRRMHMKVAPVSKPALTRNIQRLHSETHLSRTHIKVCLFYFFPPPRSHSISRDRHAAAFLLRCMCINLPPQKENPAGQNDKRLVCKCAGATFYLLHLKSPLSSVHGFVGGWGRGVLKVRLGHSRSATSINKFKLLFQIHHSHTNQCSCPA